MYPSHSYRFVARSLRLSATQSRQRLSQIRLSTAWRDKSTDTTPTATIDKPKWLQEMNPDEPMDSKRVYRYLKLETFTETEFHGVHERIKKSQNPESSAFEDLSSINEAQMLEYLEDRIQNLEDANDLTNVHDEKSTAYLRRQFASAEAKRLFKFFEAKDKTGSSPLTREKFATILHDTASSIDLKRTWPLTLSMLLVGSSVGIVTPAMPFVRANLGLSAGEYGLIVSAFALAKMTGNIPSAVFVERHGRKPYLVYSMSIIALGVGGIGLATSFEQLFLCRLVTGLGVASLSTAATMTVSDVSTPLNRASTFAPIMSAFAAGTALGPALGGILVDQVGISPTFYLVGASYVGLAAVNNTLLKETIPRPMRFPWQQETGEPEQQVTVRESFKNAVAQWIPLLSDPPIRNVCIMNGFYWVALAGSQITLLPLILTDPDGLAMTATNLGQVYMGMSLVQVFGNPILAKVVDRIGTAPGIIGGCTLISSAMVALPFCTDIYQLAGALGIWATGSSLLSTAPLAFVSDKVDDERRAQAIALLRTSGDLGFLIGASSMGALADWTGSLDMAMQSSAGILLTATGWFTARQIISSRIPRTDER